MTFRLTCPVCGARDVDEFNYGGPERGPRPAQEDLASEDHFRWVQFRMTRSEPQEEWWYHASGCGLWFSTWRNPATNREESPGTVAPDASPTDRVLAKATQGTVEADKGGEGA